MRKLGVQSVTPIWKCDHCGSLKRAEAEISCWDCGTGEMIYRGEVSGLPVLVWNEKQLPKAAAVESV